MLESDIENLKTSQFKIQIAFRGEYDKSKFQGIQVSHNGDDRTGLPVALAAVFDLHQRIDHFVNMAAVFGQKKLPSFIIIIFLHNFCGSSVALLLRTVPITF